MAREPSKPLGSVVPPVEAWLAKQATEEILEPALPIVDPHHHLWDRTDHRYLLDELLADTGSGHNVEATVFVDCMAFYREDGAAELRPVGETEFANGVAAMAASRISGVQEEQIKKLDRDKEYRNIVAVMGKKWRGEPTQVDRF